MDATGPNKCMAPTGPGAQQGPTNEWAQWARALGPNESPIRIPSLPFLIMGESDGNLFNNYGIGFQTILFRNGPGRP